MADPFTIPRAVTLEQASPDPLITHTTLSTQVYLHIKKMILSGELACGQKIPEQQLSELFGVSRTPLREALKKLNDYGLVHLKPRSFAQVVEIDRDQALEIAEVRVNLETMAATLFSRNAGEEDYRNLTVISDCCLTAAEQKNKAESFEQDSQFHLYIAQHSGNPVLFEIFEKLDARIQLLRLIQKLEFEDLKHYIQQHRQLIEAMRNGEEKLIARITQAHIMHDFRL